MIVLRETESQVDEHYVSATHRTQFSYRTYQGNKFAFTLAVWAALIKVKYDLVIVDHVNLAFILSPLHIFGLCRYTVWLHGIEVFPPRPDFEGSLGLKNASRLLANSDFTQKRVTSRFLNMTIRTCTLALDPVRHPVELPIQPISSSQTVYLQAMTGEIKQLENQAILHVGRMVSGERDKGQISLLKAFPQVIGCFPSAQLVFACQGDDLPRLKRLAQTFPSATQARIFFPGYVPADLLDRIYQKCYIFAMPSVGEGFGLVYLEAMTRAKACLGGRVDATPFVVRDGVTGLLVDDPRSPDRLPKSFSGFYLTPKKPVVWDWRATIWFALITCSPIFRNVFGRQSWIEMKILCVTPYYKPAYVYGGPTRSNSQLCEALVKLGAEVTVLTTNANGKKSLDVPVGIPTYVDGVEVFYYPIVPIFPHKYFYSPTLGRACHQKAGQFDVAFLDTIFSHAMGPGVAACKQAEVPYIITLRSALLPWGLSHKQLKKKLYLALMGDTYFNHAAALHCTDPVEAKALKEIAAASARFCCPKWLGYASLCLLTCAWRPKAPPRNSRASTSPALFGTSACEEASGHSHRSLSGGPIFVGRDAPGAGWTR